MNNKLFNILSNAIQNSEYYRDISKISIPDINEFPILTKYDVKKFEKEMLVDQYRYGDIGQLSRVFTSGSTGINTRIFWNYDDYNASNMNIWRLRHKGIILRQLQKWLFLIHVILMVIIYPNLQKSLINKKIQY